MTSFLNSGVYRLFGTPFGIKITPFVRHYITLSNKWGHFNAGGSLKKRPVRIHGCVPVFGAADEARTRYLHLGKVALYQMSYSRIS